MLSRIALSLQQSATTIPHLSCIPVAFWFLHRYQCILLGDRDTNVWTAYCSLIFSGILTGSRTCNLVIMSLMLVLSRQHINCSVIRLKAVVSWYQCQQCTMSVNWCSFIIVIYYLTPSTPAVPNCSCSKGPVPYWSKPPFLIFDIRALWCSVLSARAPKCQKLKMVA